MRPFADLLPMVITALAVGVAAAEVTVTPRLDPPRVELGRAATLDVEIGGTQNAGVPAFEVPDGLELEYRGQSTQVSVVHGAMTATVTHSFLLVPERAGTFVVGPIRVRADGRTLDGGTVRLQVARGNAAPRASGEAAAGESLRLVVSLDKPRLYLHERVPLRVRLELEDVQVTDVRYPTMLAEGFAVEQFAEPTQRREQRSGAGVHVVEFATDVVPLRAGELSLGATMSLAVVTRRGNPLFDHFFSMDPAFGGRKSVTLEAEPLTVTVSPLPEAGRPPSFAGAVGSFTLDVTAQPREVRAGDPVTLGIALRGTGNLAHAQLPALGGSDAFRVYPPNTVAESQRGLAIEKRLEQVVIPQQPGDAAIPGLEFSYFDPGAGRYATAATPAIPLRVLAAPAAAAPVVIPAPTKPPVPAAETLGRDLVTIKDDPGRLRAVGDRRHRRAGFWLLQLVPPAVWLAIAAWDRRRRRLSGDRRYARFARAGTHARRRLGEARAALQAGDDGAFYDALARTVHEYLSAKLDLPPGAVSTSAVAARLERAGVPAALVDEARALLALCEQARFAPGADGDRPQVLARADALVRALERERRVGRGIAAALCAVALAGGASASLPAESPKTLFFRGNALYGEGRFADAARAYEAVRAAGLESASLYFNLGNAWARAGVRGAALLNYERARRLAPGDPDLRANLDFVRGEEADSGAPAPWVRVALPLADRLGSDALLLAAAVAWWVLIGAMVLVRLVPAARRAGRWIGAACVLGLLLTVPAALHRMVRVDRPPWAAVLRDAPVRFEPSEGGTTHFEAREGGIMEILAERNGWAQVARRGDGRRGWVPVDALERL